MATYTIDWVNVITPTENVTADNCTPFGPSIAFWDNDEVIKVVEQSLVQDVLSDAIVSSGNDYLYTVDRQTGNNVLISHDDSNGLNGYDDNFMLVGFGSPTVYLALFRWSNVMSLTRTTT